MPIGQGIQNLDAFVMLGADTNGKNLVATIKKFGSRLIHKHNLAGASIYYSGLHKRFPCVINSYIYLLKPLKIFIKTGEQ